ncbi:DUF937 domain-containing protein [Deinococcus sp. Marseille-Q6407]|uniref:DUF937 domain-containing protein n=1 Tax=Deinococcus sp. Marseille-Q6407 TaxID=2969223 RepID=UPI0021C1BE16|nr:DUF937 domain-containing protein [Deinococcus sp. Marseille-Q6407]
MNIEELFRSRFGPESARQLAQELGLDPEQTARLLDRAARSQLEALAQHARSDHGRTQVLDAIANLPRFRDVQQALTEQGGAASLVLAGELLTPNLLDADQTEQAGQLSRVEGAPQEAILRLMNMTLPLLLSFIGQAGVNEGTITQIMSTIRGSGVRPRSSGGSYVARAAANASQNAPHFVDDGQAAAGETKKAVEPAVAEPADRQAGAEVGAAGAEVAQPPVAQPSIAQAPAVQSSTPEAPKPQPSEPQSQPPAAATSASAAGMAPSQPAAQAQPGGHPTPVPAPETQPHQPELAQDTDYSKDSVVSALLTGATVPEPGSVRSEPQPQAPAAPVKDNPYRSEPEPQQAEASQPEPELAENTDYSKDSVVSALLQGTEAAPAAAAAKAAQPKPAAQPAKEATQPAQAEQARPKMEQSQPQQASKTQPSDTKPSETKPSPALAAPEPVQPAPAATSENSEKAVQPSSGPTPEALAAAAAAAGIGGGAVRPSAPAAPAGSPWKSTPPVVVGGQPSQAPARAEPAPAPAPSPAPAAQPQATAAGPLNAGTLLALFAEQFSGEGVGALAEAVGFGRRDAARAVQGTAAVLLSALSQKGHDPAGAAELLEMSSDYGRVSTEDARLNTALLGNRAELGALEVRGLSVLNRLMDNPSQVGGRLGTALGTSGEQAGRLLALLAPFVLGLLGRRARAAGMDAAGLSRVLSDVTPQQLETLLPQGMGPLKALLSMQLFGAAPKERATLLETKQAKAAPLPTAAVNDKPAPPVQPMSPEPPRPAAPAPAQPERQGGFPWWLLALVILAGLGWYLYQNQNGAQTPAQPAQTQTAPAAGDTAFTVSQPANGAEMPASGFALSGTAQPSTNYRLLQDGSEVGTFTSGPDGTWTADVAATTAGQHTYSVQTESGSEVANLPLTLK